MMKKFPLIAGVVIILVIMGGAFWFSRSNTPKPSSYEYFWSRTCPHCAKVNEFFSSWENTDKINLDKKEVYNNRANSQLLRQRGKSCNLPNNQIGAVPLIFTPEGKCVVGDTPIINFFENLQF
jgi:glutaredoxin-related protein